MYTFSFIVGNIIPKRVKCIHSATKIFTDDEDEVVLMTMVLDSLMCCDIFCAGDLGIDGLHHEAYPGTLCKL